MNHQFFSRLFAAMLILAACASSFGAIPSLISYQGRLTDLSGNPVADNVYILTLKVYADSTTGTSLWSEVKAVDVKGGLFNTQLGTDSPLPDNLFSTSEIRFLGVKVGTNPEFPRTRLVSIAYAYQSLRADSAALARSVAPNSIDSVAIANGSISFRDIGQNGASSGQVIKWNGSAWVASDDSVGGTTGGPYLPLAGGTMTGAITNTGNPPITMGKGNFGSNNVNSGEHAFVAGWGNSATGYLSSVGGGGGGNMAVNQGAVIAGGETNTVNGRWGVVSGGAFNRADSTGAVVCGGWSNFALGQYATIPGGQNNRCQFDYSFAAGRRAQSMNFGAFVWADGEDFDFPSTSANEFAVRCTGGARFVSSINAFGNPIAGVQLAAGGGSWSSLSDRNAKQNLADINGSEILNKVLSLKISDWNYISQKKAIRHIGPMAQDFYAAFGVGEDDKHITTVDADGVALAGIQALARQNEKLQEKVCELEETLKRLLSTKNQNENQPEQGQK